MSATVLQLHHREAFERNVTRAVARRQLGSAAASLGEEVERLGELKQRRERILARLRAQVAQLDRARVALLSLRSGHAQLKAAELSALARRFRLLSTSQLEEGQAMDTVAPRQPSLNWDPSLRWPKAPRPLPPPVLSGCPEPPPAR